jgi:ribose-phosphate pyrophosphokinase
MSSVDRLALFALGDAGPLGDRLATHLGVSLASHEVRDFEDGEHKARPLESVRGRDAYVLSTLHGDAAASPNDRLCRLLFFIGALRDAGAAAVTAVVPYLCYARKDRRTKARDPVTTRYVAALFEAVGAASVVSLDVHNLAAFENAFRLPTLHLEARELFVAHLLAAGLGPLTVVSPDAGGFKRADELRRALAAAGAAEPTLALVEKRRSGGVVSGEALFGDVAGRTAVLVDDMVASGGTLVRAARRCRQEGAERVWAVATHGLFVDGAPALFAEPSLERVVVTDSIPRATGDPPAGAKLDVLSVAPLLADAVRRLHPPR